MSMIEGTLNFAKQQALTGTVDVVSTNVHDAGAAVKMFEARGGVERLAVQVTAVGGATPTFRARLVGADNAGLTTNPVTLADTGTSAALVAGDLPVIHELKPSHQAVAKRFYGVIFTLGGTTPTATANAFVTEAAQSRGIR